METDPQQVYGVKYYQEYGGGGRPYGYTKDWLPYFRSLAWLVKLNVNPYSSLDVGCAMGLFVHAQRCLRIKAEGIDVSEYAISNVKMNAVGHCKVRSATEPIRKKYEMISCIEVLEHLPEEDALKAIRNMCGATEKILFSSTPDDLNDPTHINVHNKNYWRKAFAKYGFHPIENNFVAPTISWAEFFVKK